ncbi:hypothetical protein HAX54_015209 [Datura stramonium]|uniref:Uncharacterized protein n=1 Tax=Datura stramonium TaxID=4076 RepID=A0ABS8TPF9_DATST|nr:hypothetical protein [Datura stramonium]
MSQQVIENQRENAGSKKAKEHKFKKIGKLVWYDTEVTAIVENRRMTKLTGVKSKRSSSGLQFLFQSPTRSSRRLPLLPALDFLGLSPWVLLREEEEGGRK